MNDNIKITSIKDWRINFRYNGTLYSIYSECDNRITLKNLETRRDIYTLYLSIHEVFETICNNSCKWEKGATYRDIIDYEVFGIFIKEMLAEKKECETIVGIMSLQHNIESCNKLIEHYQSFIDKYFKNKSGGKESE